MDVRRIDAHNAGCRLTVLTPHAHGINEPLPALEIRPHRPRAGGGLLYTLPNFFGEVPAVQVSPVRATLKVRRRRCCARVEEMLKKGEVPPNGVFLDATSVKARFADTDTQFRAKDAAAERSSATTTSSR